MGKAGYTDNEAAEDFNVSPKTIRNWKIAHPEFARALDGGKEIADNRVKASLYEMANGYYRMCEEIKIIEGEIVRVEVRKFFPASEVAALAWLNNRCPGEFRRNPEPELIPPPSPVVDITPENKRDIARRFAHVLLIQGGKS